VSGGEVGGIYNSKENRIVIFKDIPKVIFHELMHMSSTIITENKRYCGFYNQIGRGINEGYTQYLTEKFFPEEFEKKEEEIYKLETNYAMKTAMLIGEDKMTELYFKANLHGLVEEISKYSNKKDTIEFINCIDKINTFSHSKNPFLIMKNEVIDSCMDYIFDFLVQAYSNKINSISGLTKEEKGKMIKEYEKEFYITERRYIESIENDQEKEKSR
jgi:hypothetical protein